MGLSSPYDLVGDATALDEVKLLALSLDERALLLSALEDPPQELAELRAVLVADHQWRPRRRARLIVF